jgi:hypothetical protein
VKTLGAMVGGFLVMAWAFIALVAVGWATARGLHWALPTFGRAVADAWIAIKT